MNELAPGWDRITRSTFLPGADAARLWAAVIRPEGINAELAPFLRMTLPRGMRQCRTLDRVPLGEPLGRSWILLAGLIPVDFDDVTIVERDEGTRFVEHSSTSTARVWEHERCIVPKPGGAVLTDQLTYLLRPHLRPLRGGYRRMIDALFRHRHRRVARRLARRSPGPTP